MPPVPWARAKVLFKQIEELKAEISALKKVNAELSRAINDRDDVQF